MYLMWSYYSNLFFLFVQVWETWIAAAWTILVYQQSIWHMTMTCKLFLYDKAEDVPPPGSSPLQTDPINQRLKAGSKRGKSGWDSPQFSPEVWQLHSLRQVLVLRAISIPSSGLYKIEFTLSDSWPSVFWCPQWFLVIRTNTYFPTKKCHY